MADGNPINDDSRNTFTAGIMARLQADLANAKEYFRAVVAGHARLLTTARQEATAVLAMQRT